MLYLAGPHYFALYLLKRRDRLAWRSVIRMINRKHIYAAFGLTVLVSFGSLTLPRFDDASLSFPAKEVQSKFEIESETQTISHISNVNATFTAEQVARHATPSDAWIVIDRNVYDVSGWLDKHPGGAEIILENAGYDATESFRAQQHSASAEALLKIYWIGSLAGEPIKPPEVVVDEEPPTSDLWVSYWDAFGCEGTGNISDELRKIIETDACMGSAAPFLGEGEWCYSGQDVSFLGESRKVFHRESIPSSQLGR